MPNVTQCQLPTFRARLLIFKSYFIYSTSRYKTACKSFLCADGILSIGHLYHSRLLSCFLSYFTTTIITLMDLVLESNYIPLTSTCVKLILKIFLSLQPFLYQISFDIIWIDNYTEKQTLFHDMFSMDSSLMRKVEGTGNQFRMCFYLVEHQDQPT